MDPPSTVIRAASDRSTGLGDPEFAAALAKLIPDVQRGESAQIAAVMFRRAVPCGQVVFGAKSKTQAAWLVTEGMLRVEYEDASGQPQPISSVETGVLVGAEALFGLGSHLNSVVAAADSVIYELNPQRLALLERVVPATAQRLLLAIHGTVARQQRGKMARLERLLAPALRAPPTPEPLAQRAATPKGFLATVLGRRQEGG